VGQSYRQLFPRLPEYSRYHRVLWNAERLFAALALKLAETSAARFRIVDAKPLAIAKGELGNVPRGKQRLLYDGDGLRLQAPCSRQ
jgi:hypothetical protein